MVYSFILSATFNSWLSCFLKMPSVIESVSLGIALCCCSSFAIRLPSTIKSSGNG
ncbi:hypothetical protein MHA_2659 [Mannheimia haemolytica PHL213]|nr:hypothetical protein MHA_2659 [Mannheimia haemolytica PHL213]